MNDDLKFKVGIKCCCDSMGDAVMMNDIRESIVREGDELFILWGDGDTMPLNYCPACGKKIELRRRKE